MTFPASVSRDNLHDILLKLEEQAGKELFRRDSDGCIVLRMRNDRGDVLNFWSVLVIEKEWELTKEPHGA